MNLREKLSQDNINFDKRHIEIDGEQELILIKKPTYKEAEDILKKINDGVNLKDRKEEDLTAEEMEIIASNTIEILMQLIYIQNNGVIERLFDNPKDYLELNYELVNALTKEAEPTLTNLLETIQSAQEQK